MRVTINKAKQAFEAGKNANSGNGTVRAESNGLVTVLLFGNPIIQKRADGSVWFTNAEWNTPTTNAWLNGIIGAGVSSKKGKAYLNGAEWDGKWTKK